MKKTLKNLLENLRLGLNVYERQKYGTNNSSANKAQQHLHLLYHEFCINLKT